MCFIIVFLLGCVTLLVMRAHTDTPLPKRYEDDVTPSDEEPDHIKFTMIVQGVEFLQSIHTDNVLETTTTECDKYNKEGKMTRTVLPNVWGNLTTYDSNDVIVITHSSASRVDRLKIFLDHWKGPISIAINVDITNPNVLYKKLKNCTNLFNRTNIDLHLVVQVGVSKELLLMGGGLPPLLRWPDGANLKSKFKNDESKCQTVILN